MLFQLLAFLQRTSNLIPGGQDPFGLNQESRPEATLNTCSETVIELKLILFRKSGVQSLLTENTGSRDKIGDEPETLLKESLVPITANGGSIS